MPHTGRERGGGCTCGGGGGSRVLARLSIADGPIGSALSFELGPLRALSCVDANHRRAPQCGDVGAVQQPDEVLFLAAEYRAVALLVKPVRAAHKVEGQHTVGVSAAVGHIEPWAASHQVGWRVRIVSSARALLEAAMSRSTCAGSIAVRTQPTSLGLSVAFMKHARGGRRPRRRWKDGDVYRATAQELFEENGGIPGVAVANAAVI